MKYFIFIFVVSSIAQAQVNHLFQPGLSTRSRAMGGTSIAFARGTDALFYNPAALAKVEGYSFKILGTHLGASTNSQRLVDQMGSGSGSTISPSDLLGLYGNTYFAEASLMSGMVFPYFGAGAYSYNYTAEKFNDPVFPTFDVNFFSEYGYIVAGAIPLGDRSSIGIAGRHAKRWAANEKILVADLIGTTERDLIESRFLNKGAGEALDFSFLTSFPNSDVSLAVVWKDVGDTRYRPYSGVGPDRQENNLSLGLAWQKAIGIMDVTTAFEYNYIREVGTDFSKKIHAGAEVSFGLIDLRAGLSQGYLSYGAGVDLWLISLDVAAYSEELGSVIGQERNDRYQATLSINLDFDQAFKIKNEFGKKRRLMQRR